MSTAAHLWAIGYDDEARAGQVREEIVRLSWGEGRAARYLVLLDIAVAVRHPDGSFTIDRQAFPAAANILACTTAGFLAGLVLAAPMTGAAVGALLGGAASAAAAAAASAGIGEGFVRDVEAMMRPGTSALFILDYEADMEVLTHAIQGLGGVVLRTNVDAERAKLIQATLAAKQTGQ